MTIAIYAGGYLQHVSRANPQLYRARVGCPGMPTVKEPCFITEQVYGPGKHIFEVEMLEPWQDHDNFIPLSHLIWY